MALTCHQDDKAINMPNREDKKRIAIVGSGISGLTCAYLLSKNHHITLFEANDYLGGHTATVDIHREGKSIAVDTGFIVFNDRTYPNFIKMMNQVGIAMQATEMSFSVHNEINGLEYNGHNINTLFAQRRNLINPRFYYFIAEILRFNQLAKKANKNSNEHNFLTLGDFLDTHRFSEYFSENYILAMVAAIWSSSIEKCRDFPLSFFLRFFNNHGLLDINNRPQWYVIKGGSKQYIPELIKYTEDIRLNTPVEHVSRNEIGINITTQGKNEAFDEIIFACHSDQALALLSDASEKEKNILGAMSYRDNEVILHTDTTLLPKRKKAYASWNYWVSAKQQEKSTVTYNMNILQNLDLSETLCVTLNQSERINEEKIIKTFTYSHPVFNLELIDAQTKRQLICGVNNTHFCGAYWHNGFHEDGVKSAIEVCQRLGIDLDMRGDH